MCRGFGFVTFKEPATVEKVLKNGPHVLADKTVSALIAWKSVYVSAWLSRTRSVLVPSPSLSLSARWPERIPTALLAVITIISWDKRLMTRIFFRLSKRLAWKKSTCFSLFHYPQTLELVLVLFISLSLSLFFFTFSFQSFFQSAKFVLPRVSPARCMSTYHSLIPESCFLFVFPSRFVQIDPKIAVPRKQVREPSNSSFNVFRCRSDEGESTNFTEFDEDVRPRGVPVHAQLLAKSANWADGNVHVFTMSMSLLHTIAKIGWCSDAP